MKTLELTTGGDLLFKNGDFQIVEGVEEIRQALIISLSTNLGEWFLNREFGLDFLKLFEKPTNEQIRSEVMRVITQDDRVAAIEKIEILQDRKSRKVFIKFTVELTNGETLAEEVVVGGA